MQSKYSLKEADLAADQGQVVDTWALGLEGLVDDVARSKYRQSYLENPAGVGECLLLLEAATGLPVGAQGLIPRVFHKGSQRLDAGMLADFVVAPEHRSLGPALTLMRSCITISKRRFGFVYGTPNEKSRAILNRAGIRPWGALIRYTKLIRSKGYFDARMPAWFSTPLAALADLAIACIDLARDRLVGRRLVWAEVSAFDQTFDEVWRRARSPQLIIGDRSSRSLAWRYLPGDGPTWTLSVARERGSDVPVGYMVWRQVNGTAMTSDFFCTDVERSVSALLRSFVVHLRRFSVQRISLEFCGHRSVRDALTACGFAPREQSLVVLVDHGGQGDGAAHAISPDAVFMTSFDRDH